MSDPPLWVWSEHPGHYRAALAGQMPADALTTFDRRLLVSQLHREGLTDYEVSQLTRMTLYTAARIREDIGLRANHHTVRPEGGLPWPTTSRCA